MKRYKVQINGKTFDVVLESVEEVQVSEKKEEVKEQKIEEKKENIEGKEILAPIQGNVIDVLVKKGSKVKKGDVLLLIEAMKLENEVNSPIDGEVVEVLIQKGQMVTTNQLLIKIK